MYLLRAQLGRPKFSGLLVLLALVCLSGCSTFSGSSLSTVWQPVDFTFQTVDTKRWNEFPIQVTFSHSTGVVHTLDGYHKGGRIWGVRFAPSREGVWRWQIFGADTVGPRSGALRVRLATSREILENPNLRGHLKATKGQRYYHRADGSRVFLLADTNWYALTCRSGIDIESRFCGTVLDNDVSFGRPDTTTSGPANNNFSVWLEDRVARGFNAVMIRYVPPNLNGSNEGGCGFPTGPNATSLADCRRSDWSNLNPRFFAAADKRLKAIWSQGLVTIGHPNWLASSEITLNQAKDFTRYLLARYGAYSLIWSLSGEFQNAGGKTTIWVSDKQRYQPFRELGRTLRDESAEATWFETMGYHHPISIHPVGSSSAGSTAQTSLVFEGEPWLDHHWIQTYVYPEDIESRIKEAWTSSDRPILLSEPCYEGFFDDPTCDRYQSRYSVWVALLSGVAGHAYGVQGVFRMNGTTVANLNAPGAADVVRAAKFIEKYFSTQASDIVTPVACDSSDRDVAQKPVCARIGATWLIYLPRGSTLDSLPGAVQTFQGQVVWFDPRTGAEIFKNGRVSTQDPVNLEKQDWVLILRTD